MWNAEVDRIDDQTTRTRLIGSSGVLSFRAVFELWSDRAEFREFFTELLGGSPLEAFFWETPPVTDRTVDRPFEFVLVGAESLSRMKPDASPFRSHFSSHPSEAVLRFPNLGGDAILVVPSPLVDEACYTHLARFLRSAPRGQIDEFWRTVSAAVREQVSPRPIWVSTSGMAVSWLHVRLDSKPKYYRYEPYRRTVDS